MCIQGVVLYLIKRLRTRDYFTFAGVRPTCTAHQTGIKEAQSRVVTLSGTTHVTTHESKFICIFIFTHLNKGGNPGVRAVLCVGLRPIACCNCGFESRRSHSCLFLVNVVCCQVERSLRRADHSSRGFLPSVVCPMSVIAKPRTGRPWLRIGSKRHKRNKFK